MGCSTTSSLFGVRAICIICWGFATTLTTVFFGTSDDLDAVLTPIFDSETSLYFLGFTTHRMIVIEISIIE